MTRRLAPAPSTTPEIRARMQQVPRRNTKPELAVRRELHRRGLRYRTSIRPLPDLRCQADIVFIRAQVACFVDSCYWHGCPDHLRLPKSNENWWKEKLAWTRERDERNNQRLIQAGWTVIRTWEHEDSVDAANRIEAAVRPRSLRGRSSSPNI